MVLCMFVGNGKFVTLDGNLNPLPGENLNLFTVSFGLEVLRWRAHNSYERIGYQMFVLS